MARLVSISRVADILGVSQSTVRNWTDEGKIPHIRVPGKHRRYDEAAVLVFARSIGIIPDESGGPADAANDDRAGRSLGSGR
ncbi:MAG: hypothetical protein NVS2B16_36610 [Chloroflexota bacterium]